MESSGGSVACRGSGLSSQIRHPDRTSEPASWRLSEVRLGWAKRSAIPPIAKTVVPIDEWCGFEPSDLMACDLMAELIARRSDGS
jgi:hypothetical protein